MKLDFTEQYWLKSLETTVSIDSKAVKIDTTEASRVLTKFLSNLENDLLEIAMAVYIADRVVKRAPGEPESWHNAMASRDISIKVAVRNPQR